MLWGEMKAAREGSSLEQPQVRRIAGACHRCRRLFWPQLNRVPKSTEYTAVLKFPADLQGSIVKRSSGRGLAVTGLGRALIAAEAGLVFVRLG